MSSSINYNLYITDYILSLEENTLDDDKIEAAKDSIKNIQSAMQIFNYILEYERKHNIDKDIDKELKFIKDQYRKLDLNSYLNIKYISSLVELFLYTININFSISVEKKMSLLYNIIKEIDGCNNDQAIRDAYNICLMYILEHKLILTDKQFTRKILDKCKSVKEEEKYLTLLPAELFRY